MVLISCRGFLFPLEQANEAYDRMINNEARFRVVLEIG